MAFRCCGGYGEHWDWCDGGRPVVCRCGEHPAIARCQVCEMAQLERLLTAEGKVARERHPAAESYRGLAASYTDSRVLQADLDDRARALADDYRLGLA